MEDFSNKTRDNSIKSTDILYTLTTQDLTFVLTQEEKNPVRELLMVRIEHPKLLILEITPGTSIIENKKLLIQNIDFFKYV